MPLNKTVQDVRNLESFQENYDLKNSHLKSVNTCVHHCAVYFRGKPVNVIIWSKVITQTDYFN